LKLGLEVLGEDCGNPIKMDQEVIALSDGKRMVQTNP
jgi:hypothetical protein